MISAARDRVSVVLDFEVGPRLYRIARTLRRNGAHMVRLEERDGNDIFKNLADQVRPAADRVIQILGLEAAAFMQAVILPQGEFARFLKAPPRDRRSMLRTLLRLDVYERMRERAQRLAVAKKSTVDSLQKLLADEYAGVDEAAVAGLEAEHASPSRSKCRENGGTTPRPRSPGCAAGTRKRASCNRSKKSGPLCGSRPKK
jgi:exonuclease SbcC